MSCKREQSREGEKGKEVAEGKGKKEEWTSNVLAGSRFKNGGRFVLMTTRGALIYANRLESQQRASILSYFPLS
jgi:hypothetical protein